jgi:hypothetical protein
MMHVPDKLILNQFIQDHAIVVRMLSVLLMDNVDLNMEILLVYVRQEIAVQLAEYDRDEPFLSFFLYLKFLNI